MGATGGLPSVEIRGALTEEAIARVEDEPWLSWIRALNLTEAGSSRILNRLLANPRLVRLRAVRSDFHDDDLGALAGNPALGGLASCTSSRHSWVTDAGVVAFLDRPGGWPALREFDMSGSRIAREGLRRLAAGALPALEILNLSKVEPVATPGRKPTKKTVKALDDAFAALIASPAMRNLKELRLIDTPLGPEALIALTASDALPGLAWLNVGRRPPQLDAQLRARWGSVLR